MAHLSLQALHHQSCAPRMHLPVQTLGSPVQDMHRLAEARILAGLQAMGLVTGDVEDMVEQRIGALFMPHGACACSDSHL